MPTLRQFQHPGNPRIQIWSFTTAFTGLQPVLDIHTHTQRSSKFIFLPEAAPKRLSTAIYPPSPNRFLYICTNLREKNIWRSSPTPEIKLLNCLKMWDFQDNPFFFLPQNCSVTLCKHFLGKWPDSLHSPPVSSDHSDTPSGESLKVMDLSG